eukprot:jgi/Tetstr1/421106/TSEL_012150.t1
MENSVVHRYNTRWQDPRTETVDSLAQPDDTWRAEINWCNTPWHLLQDLVLKLQQSGAAATVLAPACWHGHPWLQQLTNKATEVLHYRRPLAICSIPGGAVHRRWPTAPDRDALPPSLPAFFYKCTGERVGRARSIAAAAALPIPVGTTTPRSGGAVRGRTRRYDLSSDVPQTPLAATMWPGLLRLRGGDDIGRRTVDFVHVRYALKPRSIKGYALLGDQALL